MRNNIALAGCLTALALLSAQAFAQTLYKSTMPDGQVIYGDKPVPGAVKVESPKVAPATKGVTPPSAKEVDTLRQLEAGRAVRSSADQQVRDAEKALADAEKALAAGKEPRPGERIGTAGGASRLTEEYWARQKGLEDAVDAARRGLDNARGTGNR